MSEQLERFISLLKGIFELDKSDLDFGVYRIMNIRKKEIEKFLTEGLPKKVREALAPFATDTATAEARIKEIEAQLGGSATIATLPPDVPMVKEYAELKAILAKGVDLSGLEADVYSHLYSFFNRYYEEGDFISKRRYKEGVYAIPYEGEEVKLYWANQDQYYIKTSENFKDYTFIAGDYTIHFKLVDATTEQNNNKEAADSKRVFMLYAEEPEHPEQKTFEFDAEKKEFIIRFIFDVPPEKKFDYVSDNVRKISQWIATNCSPLVTVLLPNISNDPKKPLTLIEKHLKAYAAKNTFDYFIHKDLRKFLSRELDFYIKNEVMHLDDVDTPNEKQVENYLAKIRAIKRVGNILIEFLSSIENFQKKLWLKKKFVVQCDYCITLDRIPEEFYLEIARNIQQWKEWEKLGFFRLETSSATPDKIDIRFDQPGINDYRLCFSTGKIEEVQVSGGNDELRTYSFVEVKFFDNFKYLMVDTKFFSEEFKNRLLAKIENFDDKCDGVLIHSENFQALNLIHKRFKEKIKLSFSDPPYNTGANDFSYKDGFMHSSWIAMMFDRLMLERSLMSEIGCIFHTIDEKEYLHLNSLCNLIFAERNRIEEIIWRKKSGGGQQDDFLVKEHDYIPMYAKNKLRFTLKEKTAKKKDTGYTLFDDKKQQYFKKIKLAKWGSSARREDRPTMYFSIEAPDGSECYPVSPDGYPGRWRMGKLKLTALVREDRIYWEQNNHGDWIPYEKEYKPVGEENTTLKERSIFWDVAENADGANELTSLWGVKDIFRNPKPSDLIFYLLLITTCNDDRVLDIFAGSGTTSHAIINLNRYDGGNRKYILVEMGDHFDTVLKPRIEKVVYSEDWKDGHPFAPKLRKMSSSKTLGLDLGKDETGFSLFEDGEMIDSGIIQHSNPYNGISHCFKYIRVESYEDALSNVVLPNEDTTGQLIARFGDEYLVKYMLDLNAADSALNLKAFAEPFSYKLKVTEKNETKEVNVDLMETFNYLIGLTVGKLYARNTFTASPDPQGEYEGAVKLAPDKLGNYTFRQIEGKLPDGKRCLIIWRNMTRNLTESNAALDAYFLYYRINPADREYDVIYVNGDNNLENLKNDAETWKVQMIEPEFKKRMFEEE